ncbi:MULTISPECIES: hypothetical protein [Burkholderia]|uniref:hypothetical protein n=1 Tax=Burkholderia TaxID=32008 RepID=UPI0021AB80E3|nr:MULTISPECIES: hypothetical protein [Burkholderia]MDS0848473.1 hypothetical protein [Burkholderia cenocepacia]
MLDHIAIMGAQVALVGVFAPMSGSTRERAGGNTQGIRHIVRTHAHIDHVGMTDRFPMTATVAISRRELEFTASGIMGPLMYTAADTKHLIDRLHTRGAIRLLDVDGTFEEEIVPGVAVRLSGGRTPGSLSVRRNR